MIGRLSCAAVALGLLCWLIAAGDDEPDAAHPAGFALVELFTSEGCSSCPPADRVASDLASAARADGAPVYVVAFHVDYWDRLGWRDRFAARVFTERQHDYARATRSDRVYTPQMIVNGQVEFVGSSTRRAERAIAEARRRPATAGLKISDVADVEPSRLTATIQVDAPGDLDREHLVLNLVVVEDGLVTEVKRGENAGRSLRHDAVARGLATVPVQPQGPTAVAVASPADLQRDNASLVVYLQDRRTMAILAAARHALP